MQQLYKRQIKQLGLNVRRIRIERDLSQYDLADMCEVDRITITRIENGQYSTGLNILFSLCAALETTIPELFAGIKIPKLEYFSLGKATKAKTKKKKK